MAAQLRNTETGADFVVEKNLGKSYNVYRNDAVFATFVDRLGVNMFVAGLARSQRGETVYDMSVGAWLLGSVDQLQAGGEFPIAE